MSQLWGHRAPNSVLSARGHATFPTMVPRDVSLSCLGESGRSRKGKEGRKGLHTTAGKDSHSEFSLSPEGHAPKNLSWIFIMVKLLIYKTTLLQMGTSPRNRARDTLGQIPLLGIISPYYCSTEGCRLARGLLSMKFTIQNWLKEQVRFCQSMGIDYFSKARPQLVGNTHRYTQHFQGFAWFRRGKGAIGSWDNDGSDPTEFPGPGNKWVS